MLYRTRIQTLLQTETIGAFLITSPENMYYFSGFTGGEGALFIDKHNRKLFTDSRYTVQAKEESPDFDIIDTADTPVSQMLATLGDTPVSFEDAYATFAFFLALK